MSVDKINNKTKKNNMAGFDDIVTSSEEVISQINVAKMISKSDVTVLILGESGTGKELFAQAIHHESERRDQPFIEINCAGIPDTLLESELFGHEKGAFTGAVKAKKGKFELASNGTLFLDEIGDMSLPAQGKILKAIEEKKIERLGSETSVTVDCRIVAATNRDLAAEVKKGRFRNDLFYRLHEIRLNIPPLRERKEDIPLLVKHFLRVFNDEFDKNIKGVSDITLNYLTRHGWSGNVRELRSLMKTSVLMARQETIWLEDLPFKIELLSREALQQTEENLSLKFVEKQHILKVLNSIGWNKIETAALLEISRPTLDKKIKEYGLTR